MRADAATDGMDDDIREGKEGAGKSSRVRFEFLSTKEGVEKASEAVSSLSRRRLSRNREIITVDILIALLVIWPIKDGGDRRGTHGSMK